MNLWLISYLLVLAAVSVALVWWDIKFHLLPNWLTIGSLPIFAFLMTMAAISSPAGAPDALASLPRAALGALFLLVIYLALFLIGRSQLGMGDVKLAILVGAALAFKSWQAFAFGTLFGFIVAGLFSAVLLITKRVQKSTEIPFGPFMLLGMWLAIFQIG